MQLVGCDPREMAEAAKLAEDKRRGDHRHQHGLPGAQGGQRRSPASALMRDLPLAAALIEATVKAVDGAGDAQDADGLGP